MSKFYFHPQIDKRMTTVSPYQKDCKLTNKQKRTSWSMMPGEHCGFCCWPLKRTPRAPGWLCLGSGCLRKSKGMGKGLVWHGLFSFRFSPSSESQSQQLAYLKNKINYNNLSEHITECSIYYGEVGLVSEMLLSASEVGLSKSHFCWLWGIRVMPSLVSEKHQGEPGRLGLASFWFASNSWHLHLPPAAAAAGSSSSWFQFAVSSHSQRQFHCAPSGTPAVLPPFRRSLMGLMALPLRF